VSRWDTGLEISGLDASKDCLIGRRREGSTE
jgi:hypothetical protein